MYALIFSCDEQLNKWPCHSVRPIKPIKPKNVTIHLRFPVPRRACFLTLTIWMFCHAAKLQYYKINHLVLFLHDEQWKVKGKTQHEISQMSSQISCSNETVKKDLHGYHTVIQIVTVILSQSFDVCIIT